MNDSAIQQMFESVLGSAFGARDPKTGRAIQFSLKPHEHVYNYYKTKRCSDMFCYTPHRDTNGNYWAFIYKAKGPGARTGQANHWKPEHLVRFRTRGAATRKAQFWLNKQRTKEETAWRKANPEKAAAWDTELEAST